MKKYYIETTYTNSGLVGGSEEFDSLEDARKRFETMKQDSKHNRMHYKNEIITLGYYLVPANENDDVFSDVIDSFTGE